MQNIGSQGLSGTIGDRGGFPQPEPQARTAARRGEQQWQADTLVRSNGPRDG